jgi:hypothetical protein
MAYKTLVTSPSSLAKQVLAFLQKMTEQEKNFALAMLVPSESGLSDRWNLVLSAPWIDRGGLKATIPTITSSLLKYLSNVNAHKLERVSVLSTDDQFVSKMQDFRIPLGEVYLLQSFPQAEGAIVLLADLPATSRSYRILPVQTRA